VTQDWKLPIAAIFGVDRQHSVCPWGRITSPGLAEVQQDRLGVVEQGEDSRRAIGGDKVKIGHAAPEQRVSLTELVMNVQAGQHRGEPLARLSMLSSSDMVSRRAW